MTTKEKAHKLHKKVRTFILSCVDAEGYPLTKAVVPGKYRETLDVLYFSTNTSSKFVEAISKNPKASVYFFSRRLIWFKGCLLKGNMKIVADMGIKEKYWQNVFKSAYPQMSFTDPDFCVLEFTPTSGRFYSNFRLDDFEIDA